MAAEAGLRRRVKGLSEAEFRQRFGTEAPCRAALFELRWGKGWACPACGHGRLCRAQGRAVYQCNRCKHQVGLTAGTVFHWTKLPLTTWFLAIYHLTQSKGGMSSVELARRLGTRQPTAWLIKHKLMAAMAAREAEKPKLEGRVEVDDAYLGGERSGGKRGRGAAGKTPFVAAVETTRRAQAAGGCGSPWSRASARRRSRRWPSATSPPAATSSPMACPAGRRSSRPAAPLPDGHRHAARRPPSGRPSPGSTPPGQHQDGARRHLPSCQRQARPALPHQLRLALQPPLPARHPDRAPRLRLRPHAPHPYRVIIAG